MLEESEECEDRSSNVGKFPDNEFYTAIMDQDSGRIEDKSKKHGSNFLIEIGGSSGEVLWKVNATM